MSKVIGVALLALAFLASPLWGAGKYGNGNGRTTVTKSTPSAPKSPPAQPAGSANPAKTKAGTANVGVKPQASQSNYDAQASADKRKEESQKRFEAYQKQKQQQNAPAKVSSPTVNQPTYSTPNGKPVAIDRDESSYWKGRLDQSRLQRQEERRRYFYGAQYDYYNRRPQTYYDDAIDREFWWWLRDQPPAVQAQWAYNHRYDVDSRRYNDLMTNAAIVAMISEMESQRRARDRYWAPSGLEPDLMYNKAYLQTAVQADPAVYNSTPSNGGGVGHALWVFVKVIFWIAFIGILVCVAVWFFRRKGAKIKSMVIHEPPPESKLKLNPLKIKENQYLSLTTLDEEDYQFKVEKIEEWARTVQGNTHRFTDYFLVSSPTADQQPIRMKLRMNPSADGTTVGLGQRILKLQLSDEMEFDGDFYNMITEEKSADNTDQPDFVEKNDDDSVKAQWWFINDVRGSYMADVTTVDEGKTTNRQVEMFQYYRDVEKQSGKQQREYLFVEIGQDDHLIQIWKGVEIDESEVIA
jgi:hypothetical protein